MTGVSRQLLRCLPVVASSFVMACAGAPASRSSTISPAQARIRAVLDSAGMLAEEDRAPRVRLRTEPEFGNPSNISAVLRLDDDAYVMVVNVGPDGYAQVIFPGSPKDDGLLRGGRSYRIPAFFPGFATNNYAAYAFGSFVAFARSEYATPIARGPGYVFAIVSEQPLDMDEVENAGLWDDFRLPADNIAMLPQATIKYYRDVALGDTRDGVGAAFARYAGWVPASPRAMASYCAGYNAGYTFRWVTSPGVGAMGAPFYHPSNLGYLGLSAPIWAMSAIESSYNPQCRYEPRQFFRLQRPVVIAPRQDSTGGKPPVDSGSVVPPDSGGHYVPGEKRPITKPRLPDPIADGQTVDLTPRNRVLARQSAWMARNRWSLENGGRGAVIRGGMRGATENGMPGGRRAGAPRENTSGVPHAGDPSRAIERAGATGSPTAPVHETMPSVTRETREKPALPPE